MTSVDEFLDQHKKGWRPGPRCHTCRQANVVELNEALRAFGQRRRERKTAMPWFTFWRLYLQDKDEWDYQHGFPALMRHVERCLGIEEA